jgi:hypothetical protein
VPHATGGTDPARIVTGNENILGRGMLIPFLMLPKQRPSQAVNQAGELRRGRRPSSEVTTSGAGSSAQKASRLSVKAHRPIRREAQELLPGRRLELGLRALMEWV